MFCISVNFIEVNRSLETPHRSIQSIEREHWLILAHSHTLSPPHFLIHSLTCLSSSFLCSASCWFLINHVNVTLFWAFKCFRANLVPLLKNWTLGKREGKWNSVVYSVSLSVMGVSIWSLLALHPIPEASDKDFKHLICPASARSRDKRRQTERYTLAR